MHMRGTAVSDLPDLHTLRVFLAVTEEGGMTAAAGILSVSQYALPQGRGSNQGNTQTRNPLTIRALSISGVTWTRLSAFSTGLKAQRSTQKMSSCAMKSRASSIGRTVRPKGPAAVHRSFQADQ